MPLLQFWKTAKEEVLTMTIEQVVSSAGDGISTTIRRVPLSSANT